MSLYHISALCIAKMIDTKKKQIKSYGRMNTLVLEHFITTPILELFFLSQFQEKVFDIKCASNSTKNENC